MNIYNPSTAITERAAEKLRYGEFLDVLGVDENYYRKCPGQVDVVMRDLGKIIIKAFDGRRYITDAFTTGLDMQAIKMGQSVIVDIDRRRQYVVCLHFGEAAGENEFIS